MNHNSSWKKLLHWEHFGLLVIVLFTLILHFIAINQPPTIVWDETWYVGDARNIISGRGDLRPEHPPLAKLFVVAGEFIFNGFSVPIEETGAATTQFLEGNKDNTAVQVNDTSGFDFDTTIRIDSEQMKITGVNPALNQLTVERGVGGSPLTPHAADASIYLFTDNAVGWRFFSILFGTLGIILFYFICKKLGFSHKITIIGTFLFAADMMTFLHSGLALLDVYMVTFMLAAVFLYLDERYIWSGVFVALSAQCKLVGCLIIFALFLHWIIYRRDKPVEYVSSLLVSGISFVVFTALFNFFISGAFGNPITQIDGMLSGTVANKFTDPKLIISSRPWEWLYPMWVNPVENVPVIVYCYDPQYFSFISPTIQLLIIPTIGYMIFKVIRGSHAAGLVLLWFAFTYLFWIPMVLITNRVTFVFYFLATTPAICIGIAMALSDILYLLDYRRWKFDRLTPGVAITYGGVILYLVLHFAIFMVFNPVVPPVVANIIRDSLAQGSLSGLIP